jgi:cytochrome c oxidase subunit 3
MSEAAKVAAPSTPRASGALGMAVFVASDASTFAALLVAYAVLRARTTGWGEGEPDFGAGYAALLTVVLVTSSAALEFARRDGPSRLLKKSEEARLQGGGGTRNRRGEILETAKRTGAKVAGPPAGQRLWLATAAALGALFVTGQLNEWAKLSAGGLAFEHSPRASSFYLLTGFHGLHVAAGTVALLVLLFCRAARPALAAAAVYWHFIAAVWLLIFACVYLVS